MPAGDRKIQPETARLSPRVGRHEEWGTLCSWLDETRDGEGGLALLAGPAGTGKSFLARHLEREAKARGFACGRGRFEARGRARIPFPWPGVLRGLGGAEPTALARQLLIEALEAPAEAPAGILSSTGMGAGRLVLPLIEALDARSETAPLLVVLEDVQNADPASVEVLRLVADSMASLPCLVLACVRPQPADDGQSSELSVEGTFGTGEEERRILLPEMAATEIEELLGEELCLSLGGTTRASELTQGSPLVANAVREAALPARVLAGDAPTPARALAAIARYRLDNLADEERTMLEALAVRPDGARASLLAAALSATVEASAATLRSPRLLGLLGTDESQAEAHFSIESESMRGALKNAIDPGKLRERHAQFADALANGEQDTDSAAAAEVAYHALRAVPLFPPEAAAAWACRAARDANAAEAYAGAATLVAEGLAALANASPATDARQVEELLVEGIAACCVQDPRQARTYLRDLQQAATDAEPLSLARLASAAADSASGRATDLALLEELRQLVQLALAGLEPEDSGRSGLVSREAALLSRIPESAARSTCETLAAEALAASDAPGVEREERAASVATYLLCNIRGKTPGERLELARELAGDAIQIGNADLQLIANSSLVIDGLASGLLEEADSAIDRLSREAASATGHPVSWYPFHLRAMRASMRADFAAARRWLEVALENSSPATYPEAASAAWLLLTQISNMTGVSIFHVPVPPYLQLPPLPEELQGADLQIPPPPASDHPLCLPWGEHVLEMAEAHRREGLVRPEGVCRAPIGASPDLSAHWRVGYAGVLSRILDDTSGARRVVEEMARQEFREIPRDAQWLASLCLAAQTCAEVESREAAAVALEQLLPYTGQNALTAMGLVFSGPVAGFAAPLARLVQDPERAHALGRTAIEAADRAGAIFAAAEARLERATLLAEESGNAAEIQQLRAEATAAIEKFGLGGLAPAVATMEEPREASTPVQSPALPSAGASEAPDATPASLMREGDTWRVKWGEQEIRLRQQRGLEFIATLVANPHQEITARTLMNPGAGTGADAATREQILSAELGVADDAGLEKLDDQALASFRGRLEEARSELAEAEENHDLGRVESLQREIDFIAQELAGATGLHGRKRRTGSDSERARVAVRKRVKGSLDRIRRELPAMHAHLSASLRTGTLCRYAPESPVDWTIH